MSIGWPLWLWGEIGQDVMRRCRIHEEPGSERWVGFGHAWAGAPTAFKGRPARTLSASDADARLAFPGHSRHPEAGKKAVDHLRSPDLVEAVVERC
jgi:hypothetical protein